MLPTKVVNLFQPGQIVEARGRHWRVERIESEVLHAVPLENAELEPASFFLPLEGKGIRTVASSSLPDTPGDAALHTLFLRAHRVSMMHGTAPLVSLQRSRVIPTNYQLVPVMMALDMPRVRLMIADDVGLGKTIEAGLVTVELLARKRVKRILVVTPANLRRQWHEAFQHFFHIDLKVLSSVEQKRLGAELPPGVNPWAYYPHVITSIDYAKTDGIRNLVLSQEWDLLIVDEAHTAAMPVSSMGRGSSDKEAFELVRDLSRKAQHVVFCTATPHNGHSVSFASLVTMLDTIENKPGHSTRAFGLVAGSDDEPFVNREKAKRHIVQRRRKDVLAWFQSEGKRAPFPERDRDPEQFIEPNKTELGIFETLQKYNRFVFDQKDGKEVKAIVRWLVMHFLHRAVSSPRALKLSVERRIDTLTKRLTHEDGSELSHATLKAMRDAAVDMGEGELFSEEDLDGRFDTLSIFDRAHIQSEIAYLKAISDVIGYWRGARDSKLKRLKELLVSPVELGKYPRTIVFTRYTDTMNYIAEELQKDLDTFTIFTIDGSLPEALRQERLRDFAASSRAVLVATDAISEGLNLQFAANQLVHYELPWNPNRLEQRNGRIDRFKQPESEVRIRTLIMQRSFELIVFEKLIQKAQRIKEAFGFVPAYFSNSTYLEEALSESLLSRRFAQASLFDESSKIEDSPIPDDADENDPALQKIASESFYGQANFRLPDVERRLAETQRTIGNPQELERLFVESLRFLSWDVSEEGVKRYRVKRSGGVNIPSMKSEFSFTFDPDLGAQQLDLVTLDLAHPYVSETLTLIRRQAHRDLEGARTAVLGRRFPQGVEPVAHATFHIRARFNVGTRDTSVIESLIPLTINLISQQVSDAYEALWSAPSTAIKFSKDSLTQLVKHALNIPNLNTVIRERIEQEVSSLTRERQALKASLLGVYPQQSSWLEGVDAITAAPYDLIALTLFMPGEF